MDVRAGLYRKLSTEELMLSNWLIWKDPYAGKDWRQKEKGTTEDEMVGWHHQHNGHQFDQAPGYGEGQGSLVCCNPWGCKESDTTELLNNNKYLLFFFSWKPRKVDRVLQPMGLQRLRHDWACVHAQEWNIFVCSREICMCGGNCQVYPSWPSELPTWAVRTEGARPINSIILLIL